MNPSKKKSIFGYVITTLLSLGLVTFVSIVTIGFSLLHEPGQKDIRYNLTGHKVSFIALGDQGTGNYRQYQVAKGMGNLAKKKDLDFVMLLGDNFYRYGVESTDDRQWRYKFENMYRGSALEHIPFYAVLGNHDYGGNEQAEIQYSQQRLGSGRWHMPAKDYVEYYGEVDSQPLLKVIYLDTSPCAREHENTVRKLSALLTHSKPSYWTLVASHVPLRTGSSKYFDQALVDLLVPVLKQFHVDAYLSGHDHNQQLIVKDQEPAFIVSGTGGKHGDPLSSNFEPDLAFSNHEAGFVYTSVDQDSLNIEFYNSNEEQLYSKHLSHDPQNVRVASIE